MNYDAEIRVKTDLDNGKFEVSARKVKESLDEIGRKADGACAKLDSMEKAGELKDSRKYRNVVKELERWIDALDELIKKREMALDNMELDWDVSKGSIRDDAGYQKVLQEWSEAEGKARELQARTGKYFSDSAETVRNETGKQKAAVTDFSDHLNLLRTDVEEYASALKELEEQGKYFGDADYDRLYLAWKNAVDEVKKYQAELNKQTDAGQAKEAEKAARAAEKQEAIQQRLEAQAERNLQKENAWIQAEAEKQAKLQAEEAEQQRLAEIKANATVADQRMIDLLERKRQLTAEIAELEKAGVTAGYREYDSATRELASLNSQLKGYKENMNRLPEQFSKLGSTSLKVFSTIRKGFSSVGSAGSKAFSSLGNVVRKVFSSISGGAKKSSGLLATFASRMKGLALSLLIFNWISKGFNAMISGMKTGFENLMKYSDDYASSVQSLRNAMATLGNSFAAAFAPIVQVAIPYLVELINWINRAVNAIGQLFAYLTGKSTWTKAAQIQNGYNSSLNGTAAAAKKAYGALARFDDLDVWEKQKDASDGGAGGNGMSPGEMFEEVPIDKDIKKFGDWLKDLFSKLFEPFKAAWEREGKFVMDAWKYALEEVRKLLQDIGRDFLTVWNQEATIQMFADILHIIGDIGLIVGNLAKNFREAWNENQTGLHILENIRDIFAVIVRHVRNAADATVEWSKKLDFGPLLEAFERFTDSLLPMVDAISGVFEDFYTRVLLPLGKWTIEKGLPELLDVLTRFVEEVDWYRLRTYLQELWDHLEPFAETVGEGLILFIERVLDLAKDFLNSDVIMDYLERLGNWMDTVTPEDVADGIELLAKSFIGLKVALAGLDLVIAGSKLISFLANLKILFGDSASAARDGSDAIEKVSKATSGLSTALEILGTTIASSAFFDLLIKNPEINLLEKITGDESTADKMRERYASLGGTVKMVGDSFSVLKNTLQGYGPVISGSTMTTQALANAMDDTSSGAILTDKRMETLQKRFSMSSEDMEMLRTNMLLANPELIKLADSFEELYDASGETLEDIQKGLELIADGTVPAAEALDEFSKPMWGMNDAALEFFKNISEGKIDIDDFITLLKDTADATSDLSAEFEGVGENIVKGFSEGVKTGISEDKEEMAGKFTELVDDVKERLGIHSPSTVFQEIGINLIEGLLLGIQETWVLLTEWFATTFEELALFFEGKWTAIKESAIEIWTTLKDTLLETWENIRESASEKFEAVKKVFEDVWTRIKQVLDEKAKNIKEKIDELLTKFTNFKSEAATAFENVKNSVVNALNPVIEKLKVFVQWVKDAIAAVQDFFNSGYEKVGTSAGKTSKGGGISAASFSMSRSAVRAAAADLPHLASGSVIRGGNPFLAVLGDQRSGQTNVEAPLSTIRQAVREELAGLSFGGGNVQADMTLDGETFARLLVPYILDEMNRQGLDVNVLGVT